MLTLFEIIAYLIVVVVGLFFPTIGAPIGDRCAKLGVRLARRRWLSASLIALLALSGELLLAWSHGLPQPTIHDEFAYLLTADTFASGRLTNPTPPHPEHFESFHILLKPTYQAKYPPGQGLFLAFGQALCGEPIVGVWLSTAIGCAAIYWMLLGWVPPVWALYGGILAALHPGILLLWGQSYWGGAVAMMGGALLFGALPRVLRKPRVGHCLLLGLGLVILANSRPYEGMLASLPVALVLAFWQIAGKNGVSRSTKFRRCVVPIAVVLMLGGAWMGYYNWRVTGSAWKMPYQAWVEQYTPGCSLMKSFWLGSRTKPVSATPSPASDETMSTPAPSAGLISAPMRRKLLRKLLFNFHFYARIAFLVPLLICLRRSRRLLSLFAYVTLGIVFFAVMADYYSGFAHYAAPVLPLVFYLIVQGSRYLRQCRIGKRPFGQYLVRATLLMWIVNLGWLAFGYLPDDGINRSPINQPRRELRIRRGEMERQLEEQGGKHLIFVRYSPRHISHVEWVYNKADLNRAMIIWAHELTAEQNRQLMQDVPERTVWLLEADLVPVRLTPYPNHATPTG